MDRLMHSKFYDSISRITLTFIYSSRVCLKQYIYIKLLPARIVFTDENRASCASLDIPIGISIFN